MPFPFFSSTPKVEPTLTSPYSQYSDAVYGYAERCQKTSDQVIKTKKASSAIFSDDFGVCGYVPFSSHKIESNQSSPSESAIWAGIILTLGIAFFLGSSIKGYSIAKSNYNESLKIEATVKACEKIEDQTSLHPSLTKLIETQLKIDKEILTQKRNYLAATVIVITGGASLIIGGIASIPMIITAGIISTCTGIFIGLFNLGYYSSDEDRLKHDYQLSHNLSQDIFKIFERHKETLKLQNAG